MDRKKMKQIETLETLWSNTSNLISAARAILNTKKNASYAFVLLQTASEEMGRIWALWLHFDGHESVPVPPKDEHGDKHAHFITFMSFQPVGHRNYFEIISDITGFKITKENAKTKSVLQKIKKFREKNLYVTINQNNNHIITQPLESETIEKQTLVEELYSLLNIYMKSMLRNLIQQYKNKNAREGSK